MNQAAPGGSCPGCRAPVGPGQALCVVCGRPLERGYRRAPSWRLTVLAAISLLVLLGLGAGFGAGALVHTKKVRAQDVTTSAPVTPVTPAVPATPPVAPAPAPVTPQPARPVTPKPAITPHATVPPRTTPPPRATTTPAPR